jgi:asparaginyl-tRNA synthetase
MEKAIEHIRKEGMGDILRIQSALLRSLHDYMHDNHMIQMMPVMLSPFTDPLNHPIHDSSIIYDGQRLELTKSMILHKQLSLMRDDLDGIFIVSPNIRLEQKESAKSGRHLFEFSQVDIELKGADHRRFMEFLEGLYRHMFSYVRLNCKQSLERFDRLDATYLPDDQFKVYQSSDLESRFGPDWEHEISIREKHPFWVMDHSREFYDREDPSSGRHINYDLVYPGGFGEALSGGERETDYDVILRKMKERRTDPAPYQNFLRVAKKGELAASSGGGFGFERLIRFLTGASSVRDVCLFPRVPGETVAI